MVSKIPAVNLGSDLWNKIKLSKSYAKQDFVGLGVWFWVLLGRGGKFVGFFFVIISWD